MSDRVAGRDLLAGWLDQRQGWRGRAARRAVLPPGGVRFAFYGRVSTCRFQDAESSRAWQRECARELIVGDGSIVTEYFDVGCTRRMPWPQRPAASALLDAAADPARAFDAIVVGEYERAFVGDQLIALLPVLQQCGVRLWLPEVGGAIDGADPEHRALIRLLGAQSRREVARVRFRVVAAMRAQVVEQGRYLGGRPPYGYRLADAGPHPNGMHAVWGRRLHRLVPDPVTAPWVRWIFARRLSGDSIASIARTLNERNVACPSGADPDRNRHRSGAVWTVQSVAAILGNPRYTGRQVWNRQQSDHADQAVAGGVWRGWNPAGEWVVSRGIAHEPLVSEVDFVAAQSVSAVAAPRDGSVRRYLLVGLVRCGVCGRRMESCWVHGRAGYRCRHGHASCKSSRSGRSRNLYLRQDRILEQIAGEAAALDGTVMAEDVIGLAPGALVEMIRAHRMVIICHRSGCRLTGEDENTITDVA